MHRRELHPRERENIPRPLQHCPAACPLCSGPIATSRAAQKPNRDTGMLPKGSLDAGMRDGCLCVSNAVRSAEFKIRIQIMRLHVKRHGGDGAVVDAGHLWRALAECRDGISGSTANIGLAGLRARRSSRSQVLALAGLGARRNRCRVADRANMLPLLALSRWLYLRHVDRQMNDSIPDGRGPELHGIDETVASNSQG
jgi:hypothetical protein